jgi:hypothetical protein
LYTELTWCLVWWVLLFFEETVSDALSWAMAERHASLSPSMAISELRTSF